MAAKKHSRVQSLAIATDGIAGTYNAVVSVRDATLSGTKDMTESTTRENGPFHDYLDGLISATIDVTAAWDESDAVLMALVDAHFANTTLHARWRNDTGGGLRQYKAQVKVAAVNEGASSGSLQTADITLQICGTPTRDTQ